MKNESSKQAPKKALRKTDVSGSDINYKQLYHELYENVAKMLVENRQHNWHPQVLLMKWDNFRK